MVNDYKKALHKLWIGRCSVYVKHIDGAPNPDTGRTRFVEMAVAVDVPCRLSFVTVTTAVPNSGASRVTQTVKLFLDHLVPLPPGSKLSITQNGITGYYVQSGEAANYTNHKEIQLKLFERWA